MDPATRMYGIAKSAITRLNELESRDDDADDTATNYFKELNEAAEALFATGASDLWKAYTLMSQAAGTAVAGLDMAYSLAEGSEQQTAIDNVAGAANDLISRSQTLAGLGELKTAKAPVADFHPVNTPS